MDVTDGLIIGAFVCLFVAFGIFIIFKIVKHFKKPSTTNDNKKGLITNDNKKPSTNNDYEQLTPEEKALF